MTRPRSDRHLGFDAKPEPSTVRRLVAGVLALGGSLGLLGLGLLVPGLDRVLGALSVAPLTLVTAVAALLVVGGLLVLAPTVRVAVEGLLDGPEPVVEHVGASAGYLVAFVAVVVGYEGFAGVVEPLLAAFDVAGLYHLAFLGAGVATLGLVAVHLYRCWTPVTELVTATLVGERDAGDPVVE